MVVGPIPWNVILEYAIYVKLEDDLIEPFIQIIRQMDAGYLHWQNQKQKRERDVGKQNASRVRN